MDRFEQFPLRGLLARCAPAAAALLVIAASTLTAEDWLRFRGPIGSGISADSSNVPTQWSPNANLAWKSKLPGPGVSSPIIVGSRVVVTCYSGYGLERENPGEIKNLVRHVVCCDLKTGEKLWQKDVPAVLPEDPYTGIGVTAHGYASHTPVSDGKNVFAYFGKSGVHAFDLDGNALWTANVGKESDPWAWGSSSSPILHENLVIVTASAESQALVGLDKSTGKQVWRQEAKGLDGMWGTPMLVTLEGGRTDLVMNVAKEMWGLDPVTGKLRWYCEASGAEQAHSSVIAKGEIVYAVSGRDGGSIAVRAGGQGDVTETHTEWTGGETGRFSTPILAGKRLYLIGNGVVTTIDAATGEKIGQTRLSGAQRSGGNFGSLDYPSPVVAGDKLFYLNGSGQMFVFELGDEVKQVAVNRVTADSESFGGTPAISDGQMVLRSAQHLYCVVDKGETVAEPDNQVASSSEDASPRRPGGFGGDRGGAGGARGGGQGGNRGAGGDRGAGGSRGGAGGGRRGFNPTAIFDRLDADKDGKLTEEEIANNPTSSRLTPLDKDEDKVITKEEFQAGISGLFGGRGGGGRGGPGGRGGREDNRPDRPQRPEMANAN